MAANLHLAADPVEVHPGMIGEVGGVLQLLIEETGTVCLDNYTLPSPATGYHTPLAKRTGRLQECGGQMTSLRVTTF